jgi:GntP family gluconate:H+ symporter
MGIVISSVPAIVGGVWYAAFINRRLNIEPQPVYGISQEEMERNAKRKDSELPSFVQSITPVLLPVFLISASTLASVLPLPDRMMQVWSILGDKDIAFLLGTALAVRLVVKQRSISIRKVFGLLEPAIASGAGIAFITCSGGAFGRALTESGVGILIADAAKDWGISFLLLAFVTALLIRVAQGSATVAMITTAGIIAPAISSTELSYHPVYLVSIIGFGATACSWMNDSGFWIVCKMGGLTETETLKTWTVLLTIIAIVGFIWASTLAFFFPLA